MDTYLELLPQELINIISSYLDYTEVSILEQEFGLKVNYQLLVYTNHPAFGKILKLLKEKDIKWKDYPYSKAYDLMNLIEKYVRFEIEDSTVRPNIKRGIEEGEYLRTDNISNFINFILDAYLMIGDMDDVISSYFMLTEKKGNDLRRYKILFPNITDGETIINSAYADYPYFNSLDETIVHFNESKGQTDLDPLVALYIIFIYVLDHLDTLDEYKDKIIKIDPSQKVTDNFVPYNERFLSIKIVYQHIIEFIRAQENISKEIDIIASSV